MEPKFTFLLISVIIFALLLLFYIHKRFGWANAISFLVLSGAFTAIMDFLSAYVEVNYEYPGKSKLWVFAFIFFGWTGIAGSCLFLAEKLLTKHGEDLYNKKSLWWKAPLLTGFTAVVLDLFIDPIAAASGYWVWFAEAEGYYNIPLLNFTGWFVLMFCAPMAWILIIRRIRWKDWQRLLASILAILPLMIVSGVLSTLLRVLLTLARLK